MSEAGESIQCFFCRDSFSDKDKLEDHLIYQHGVVFNVGFMAQVSHIKTTKDKLPVIDMNKKNNNQRLCRKCKDPSQAQKKKLHIAPVVNREEKLLSTSRKENNDVTAGEASQTLEETVTAPPVDNNTSVVNGGAAAGAGARGEDNSFVNVKVKPQNIRDKTNTYCNVCDVNLSTRILFLSHCSSVHDVKFKGKSGQPLVIPQDKDRMSMSMSGKTGTSPRNNDSGSGSPARKKAKLNNSINDPNNPRRAPVPCTFCGKVFSNLSNKERHERQSCKNADKGQIEEKEFKCTVNNCDRQFAKLGYLKKHQLNEHQAENVPE